MSTDPLYVIAGGVLSGFIMTYSFLGVTEQRRIPSWACYLVGIMLMVACSINNMMVNMIDPTVLFILTYVVMAAAFSKDRIVKKLITFVCYVILIIVMNVIVTLIAGMLGVDINTGSTDTEYFRSFSTILMCDACMISVLIYKRVKIRNAMTPALILVLIPQLMLLYIAAVILDKGQYLESLAIVTGITAIVINASFVLLFLRFIAVSKRVHNLEREKELIAQLEGYDKEYFGLVQSEVDKTRFIRHDVVNYMEQIKTLAERGDAYSAVTAGQLISELESRLEGCY